MQKIYYWFSDTPPHSATQLLVGHPDEELMQHHLLARYLFIDVALKEFASFQFVEVLSLVEFLKAHSTDNLLYIPSHILLFYIVPLLPLLLKHQTHRRDLTFL